jgi:hypothetical protein
MIAGAAALPAAALAAGQAQAAPGAIPSIASEPWLRIVAEVAAPQIFGKANGTERRCVPVLGGSVTGRFEATILPGGADWQRVLPDGTTELEVHYAMKTAAGDLVEVSSSGLRSGPPEAMKALLAGQPVDPALIYFRAAYRFATAAPALAEFTRKLFIGVGRREPSRVLIEIYLVE